MTVERDIVERLRQFSDDPPPPGTPYDNIDPHKIGVVLNGMCKDMAEAADEIERLREMVAENPNKWPFETLMVAADRLLEEHYPSDIFTGASGDPGSNLVVALRDCRARLASSVVDQTDG